MAQRKEYRVVWQRQERRQSTRIYQSHSSAWRKARAVLAMEAVKDLTHYTTMPPLAERPVIQVRTVGEWEPVEWQVGEVEEHEKKSMLQHMRWTGKAEYPDGESDHEAAFGVAR